MKEMMIKIKDRLLNAACFASAIALCLIGLEVSSLLLLKFYKVLINKEVAALFVGFFLLGKCNDIMKSLINKKKES